MPIEDEEQQRNNKEDFIEVANQPEEDTEGQQKVEDGDESSSDVGRRDTEGKLGDEEEVMSDNELPKQPGKVKRFFVGYWHKKKWTLPFTILALIAIVFAVPASRYPLLALGLKRSYDVTIVDSKTSTPVSGAQVMLDGNTATTDSNGKAVLTAKVGKRTLEITKQYYKNFSETVFVGVSSDHNAINVQLAATGRQVPIMVVNKITGKPVANAEVKVLDTEARTGADGKATIVLPTTSPVQSATVAASGYNDLTTNVQVTSKVVSANTFSITPSGRIYFLSNLSGNIDVVSTHLDGTDRKTVLAGTGSEDPNDTVLLASRDWKYLALLSKRDGGQNPKLFLINASDNSVTTMDSTAGSYTLIGWSEHYFVYQVGHLVKSFNADSGSTVTLANADVTHANDPNGDYQAIWETVLDGSQLFYDMSWYQNPGYLQVSGKSNTLNVVDADGSGAKVLKTTDAGQCYFSNLQLIKPGQLHFGAYCNNSSSATFYRLDTNGNITQDNTITNQSVNQTNPTYLISPSGNQSFWSEQRDGKNSLFVGDYYGNNGNQIASLSDYQTYGWYTDNYLLVEKSGSELYIMPVSGGNALKISDYYKPPQNFYGYGGGYGGL